MPTSQEASKETAKGCMHSAICHENEECAGEKAAVDLESTAVVADCSRLRVYRSCGRLNTIMIISGHSVE